MYFDRGVWVGWIARLLALSINSIVIANWQALQATSLQ